VNRINIIDVEFNDDYSYSYRGKAFSGVACEYDDNSKLIAELTFENGIQEGVSRWFFSSGQKRSEKCYHFNTLHGEGREWFEDGNLRERTLHEFGVLIEKDTWDADSNSISTFRIAETDQAYATLQKLRKAKWQAY
jgi:antitoxin component YwqK of YwqJK toxin-antitoxin module